MTYTQLVQKRKSSLEPDKTFDLDGDGFISQKDFKIAHTFDKDKDGRLNSTERQKALDSIQKGEAELIWKKNPKKNSLMDPKPFSLRQDNLKPSASSDPTTSMGTLRASTQTELAFQRK